MSASEGTPQVGFERLVLAGDGVYLRAPRERDHDAWAALRAESKEFLQPWEAAWPVGDLSRAAFRRRLRAWRAEAERAVGYALFVFRKDNVFVGACRILQIQPSQKSATVAYWIGAPHARRGHMRAAMAVVLDFAFGTLGLHRLEATCEPSNIASRSLLLSLGFQQEGHARGLRYLRDAWQDSLLFGLLADDPRPRRSLGPSTEGFQGQANCHNPRDCG